MTLSFDGRVIVPVGDPDDGERTAATLAPRLEPTGTAVVVYVVEKADGAIDKTSVEHSERYAADVFERARPPLERSDGTVETEVLYGADVVEAIFDEAVDRNADCVAFVPREGNRLVELLSGDVARRLIREGSVPVVALPDDGA